MLASPNGAGSKLQRWRAAVPGRNSRGRVRAVWKPALLVLIGVLPGLVWLGLAPAGAGPDRSSRVDQDGVAQVRVSIDSSARGVAVPRSFLGISMEYQGLSLAERQPGPFERVLGLLRVAGGGPVIMRVGGDSADHTFLDATGGSEPGWAVGLSPGWFARTGDVVRRSGLRVIVDLNLATASSDELVELAAEAARTLPRGSLAGFELGNEPDLYHHALLLTNISRSGDPAATAALQLTPSGYVQDFASDGQLLAATASHVRLVGPAVAFPRSDLGWLATLAQGPHPRLRLLSAHLYPYNACARPTSSQYPTVARLLSPAATSRLPSLVAGAVRVARAAGLPLRLTELNSVSCGGRPGVSNTFATGLWAPDALFEVLRAGVAGVNVHVRPDKINGAFAITDRGLIARPLLYGLILFARTLGPDARLLPVHVATSRGNNVKVWAVRVSGDRLHVLVINKSDRDTRVHLGVPAPGVASVQRLRASSPRAISGVTLDGQWLGHDGRWHGRRPHETVTPGGDGYSVHMPRFSAALISFRLAR